MKRLLLLGLLALPGLACAQRIANPALKHELDSLYYVDQVYREALFGDNKQHLVDSIAAARHFPAAEAVPPLLDLLLAADSSDIRRVRAIVERYEKEKDDIKRDADRLEAEARQWDEKSEMQMHLHHRWAQATTALQVAIALAAIALLTKKKWLEYAMLGVAALGLGVGGLAMLHI